MFFSFSRALLAQIQGLGRFYAFLNYIYRVKKHLTDSKNLSGLPKLVQSYLYIGQFTNIFGSKNVLESYKNRKPR